MRTSLNQSTSGEGGDAGVGTCFSECEARRRSVCNGRPRLCVCAGCVRSHLLHLCGDAWQQLRYRGGGASAVCCLLFVAFGVVIFKASGCKPCASFPIPERCGFRLRRVLQCLWRLIPPLRVIGLSRSVLLRLYVLNRRGWPCMLVNAREFRGSWDSAP